MTRCVTTAPETSALEHARHAALSAAGDRDAHGTSREQLGLGMLARRADHVPLTRILREAASTAERAQLVAAWCEALGRLHAAGWGTDGVLAAALWRPRSLAPGWDVARLWPLGTTRAARPVAALVDWDELRAWLAEALGAEGSAAALEVIPPRALPWTDYPAAGVPGVNAFIGPPAELAALAGLAGLVVAMPGDAFGWRSAGAALAAGRPVVLPLAAPADLGAIAVTLARVSVATACGADPSWLRVLGSDALEALGIPPALLAAPLASPLAVPATPQPTLETAPLFDAPEARAHAEAEALLALAAGEDDGRLDIALGLARDARSRLLACRVLIARAAATRERDPKRAFADLAEARRVAGADQSARVAVDVAALERLMALTEGVTPPMASGDAGDETPLGQVARELAAVADAPDAVLSDALRWLAMVNLAEPGGARDLALALVAELVAASAILAGREAAGERIIRRARGPRPFERFAMALGALLSARRQAVETTRERLVLLGADPAANDRRARSICRLAAQTAGLDGLIGLFGDAAPRPECRIAWCALAPTDRRARPFLERWDDARIPPGAALALGLAYAGSEPGRARALFTRATAADEIHTEYRALEALATLVGPGAIDAERIADRLRILGLRRPHLAPIAHPHLTPDAAIDEILTVLAAAARAPTWAAAVATVCGSASGPLLAPDAAAAGVAIVERAPGLFRLEPSGDPALPCDLAGPLALPPARAERLLAALAPRFAAPRIAIEPPTDVALAATLAAALADDLAQGRAQWAHHVQKPFKRRELPLGVLRALIRQGLGETHGLYRALAERWRAGDYRQFMAFLRRADALIDYRPYRDGRRGLRD